MKPVSDLSVVCVAAVLVSAMLLGPPARQSDIPPAPGPSRPASSSGTRDVDEANAADRAGDHRDDPKGHERLKMASEPWSRRIERPRSGRDWPAHLTPELIDACLAVAQDIDLQLAAELRKQREEDPQQFERRLRHSRRLIALAELWQRDPELYEQKKAELTVDTEVMRLAREVREAYRQGRTADAEALKKELRTKVIWQLGISLAAREEYVRRLRQLVSDLEEELACQRQPDQFNQMVQQRMDELLSDPSVDHDPRGTEGPSREGEGDRPPPP
jgi:hypothetical protein